MDSFNDSTKTNLLPHHRPQQQQSSSSSSSSNPQKKDNQKPLIISLIILSTLIIAAIITSSTAQIIRQFSRTNNSIVSPSPSESIRFACSFTPYKRSCRTTLSSSIAAAAAAAAAAANSNNSDYPLEITPEQIIFLSLQLTVTQLTHLSSLPKILNSKPNDPQTKSALLECQILFDEGMSRLNNSIASMDPRYPSLTDGEINDLVGWLRAVGTHQQACLDRLEENGLTVLDEVRSKVKYTRKYVSNTLAILANTSIIFDRFYGFPVEDYSSHFIGLSNQYTIVCILQYVFLVFLLSLMLRLY